MEVKNNRIKTLETLRVFSIFVIIIYHLGILEVLDHFGPFYRDHLHNATFAVNYFFLLSGFGLMLSAINQKEDKKITIKTSVSFAFKRIKKIYPLIIISFIPGIYFAVKSLVANGFPITNTTVFIINVFLAPSLLQSLTGISVFSHAFNGVVWFYSCLAIIYFLAPFITSKLKKITKTHTVIILIIICTGIIILLTYLFNMIDGIWWFDDMAYGSPFIRVFYTMIGMLTAMLYSIYNDKSFNKFLLTFLELVSIICVLTWFFTRNICPIHFCLKTLIDIVIAFYTLLVFSFEKGLLSKILGFSFFTYQAKYVPYIYLIHYPTIILTTEIGNRFFELSKTVIIMYVVISILVSILLSLLYYYSSIFIRKTKYKKEDIKQV